MKKIGLKQQMFIVTSAIAAFGALVGFLIILPTFQSIRDLQTLIGDTQRYLEEQYERTKKMKKSVHSLADVTEQIAGYELAVVKSGDELSIITQLEKLAVASAVSQTLKVALTDQPETKSPGAEKIPSTLRNKPFFIFSFVSEGAFNNLVKYLKTLEAMPYYFNIDSLQFSKNKDNDLITLKFSGQLYILD